ncbi:MAG: glycosyl hydrolase, partial [Eudoraea sp.]
SMANEAVIHIRKMRNQIEENKGKVSSADYKKTMMPFLDKSSAIEQELYQVKNQSGQDPLNFPIKLNNRLASLRRSIENGEAKPTDGAYKVYEELSSELEEHLGDLNKIMSNELPKVNSILEKAGASPLEEMK